MGRKTPGGDSIGSGMATTTIPWGLINRYRLYKKREVVCALESCSNVFYVKKKSTNRKYCVMHTGVPTVSLRREVELNAKKRS
jgi:hypothetical protein